MSCFLVLALLVGIVIAVPEFTANEKQLALTEIVEMPRLHGDRAKFAMLGSGNIPAYELQALYDLYNATNGEYWIWTSYLGARWVFSSTANPCVEEWQGVTCSANATVRHVTGLSLPTMNLDGTIPASLGVLSELQQLYMQTNGLYGGIPDAIGNCTALTTISLFENGLNGTLPDSICDLHNLTSLNVHSNALRGHLPDRFGSMTKLQIFNVARNQLTGPLPVSLASCIEMTQLLVAVNYLYGPLPESYGALTKLIYLALLSNSLYGTIPASYGSMTQLQYFHLYDNDLSGTIPDVFGGMQLLEYFYVGLNRLTGSIPESLSLAAGLYSIDVSQNFMNGTLSAALGNLAELNVLYGYQNMFSGTLPPELGDCLYMFYVIFSDNELTGKLPSEYSSWEYLSELQLDNNLLSGPIPPEYGNFKDVSTLQLSNNALTGALPANLSSLTQVVSILISNNMFSGPLPDALFVAMKSLSTVNFAGNDLDGPLPSSLSAVPRLDSLDLRLNGFTGTLPASYGVLTDLEFFMFDQNYITGLIPNTYGGMRLLRKFFADSNLLSGSIPPALGFLQNLQFYKLQNNMITGTIPASFANLGSLLVLIANGNYLTGNIENIFNASAQVELVTVVLNDNQLSGTLPAELFRLQKLNSFGAVSNCFHGQLPSTVCDAQSLVTLALDAQSSQTSCRDKLLPGTGNSYTVQGALHGSLPACLFDLPSLSALHLSGNGFSGSLPDGTITPFLLDLSLSHNILTGTIPDSIQTRQWYNLDLSHNRLSGSLHGSFQSQAPNATAVAHFGAVMGMNVTQVEEESSLSLKTNRLSGALPQVVQSQQNVSVLGSNVFSCDADASDLPEHDSGRHSYQCGSDSFNVPFYLWLALAVMVLVCALLAWRYQGVVERLVGSQFTLRDLHKWATVLESHRDIVTDDRVRSYRSVLELSAAVCKIAAWCTVCIVLTLLPLYAGSSERYGTLLHQYAWTVSAAYLSGWVPTMLMLVFLIGLLVLMLIGFLKYFAEQKLSAEVARAPGPAGSTALVALTYALFLMINLVVVVGANIAYVYIAVYEERSALFVSQLALACFKLFWSRFFSMYLTRWTAAPEARSNTNASDALLVTAQLAVALLNNIAIPCLVVAAISPSCFYHVFTVAPEISTTYTYQTCTAVDGSTCASFESGQIETSYNPSLTYNYQCSSSFITYYAPIFVLLCLMHAFILPMGELILQQLHRRAVPGTSWFAVLDSMLLPNLKSIVPGEPAQVNVFKPFLDANQLLLSLFTYLGLLLTFGAMFPPVAVALLVTLLAVAHFNKLKVSRFLSHALEQSQLDYVDAVEAESGRSGFLSTTVLERAVWMLVTVSCWFYTLFLFDTLGDAVGFQRAYWLLIVMPLMPLVLYALWRGVRTVHAPAGDVETGQERATEMSELGETTVNILH